MNTERKTSKREASGRSAESRIDYAELLTKALQTPDVAFEEALSSGDADALACLGVFHAPAGGSQLTRFKALVAGRAGSQAATRVILAFAALGDQVSSEVREHILELLRTSAKRFPADKEERTRIVELVRSADQPDMLRRRMLLWLSAVDPRTGRAVSLGILADPTQPPSSQVTDRALRNLVESGDEKLRERAKQFALDQFAASSDPNLPARTPQVSVAVLEHFASRKIVDVGFPEEVFRRFAENDLEMETHPKQCLSALDKSQLRDVAGHLADAGHAAWLERVLMPLLLMYAPQTVAATASAEWWTSGCRMQIANHSWEQVDEGLYVTVLRGLHETSDEAARTHIRQRIGQRCATTAGASPKEMPRLGARALAQLAISGAIAPHDPHLIQALNSIPAETLTEDLMGLAWKQPQRAERLGQIVAASARGSVVELLRRARTMGEPGALALLRGLGPAPIEESHEEVVEIVAGSEQLLSAAAHASEEAAESVLTLWRERHDMTAFRALAGTTHDADRLANVPSVIRAYDRINHEQRRELLSSIGATSERVEVLIQLLQDRTAPLGSRPSEDDLVLGLELLGQHLDQGLDPDRVIGPINEVCEKATQVNLRKAGYEALGHADPRESVVSTLLRRRSEDTKSTLPTIDAALARLADKLDQQAAQGSQHARAESATLLAMVDPAKAPGHARRLLSADEPEDRIAAAEILAISGSPELDVPLIEKQLDEEPSRHARDALRRAMLRLQIGDLAAAHERLGELAGIGDGAWHQINPSKLYGDWSDGLVQALERVATAEAKVEYGTAIDQLGEASKMLLFRAIEVAGVDVPLREDIRAKAANNTLDYGATLRMQQLQQTWSWVSFFASIHELRTEHVTPRGSTVPNEEADERDWDTVLNLFKRGARGCLTLLRQKAEV